MKFEKQQIEEGIQEYEKIKEEKYNEFEGWNQRTIDWIKKNIHKIETFIDGSDGLKDQIEKYNQQFNNNPDEQFQDSSAKTIRKGVQFNNPTCHSQAITPEFKRLYQKCGELYWAANDLDTQNRHVRFYIDFLNGKVKNEPYAWIMNYGMKMPVFTKEEYEETAEHYDIDSERTDAPTVNEMMVIVKELGYEEDIIKE